MSKAVAVFLITLFFLCTGCFSTNNSDAPGHVRKLENLTVYPADAGPTSTIQLIREQAFGDTDNILIGNIADIAVDEQGRVFIADGQQFAVHVYKADGSYMAALGGKGKGPGEFQDLYALVTHANHLYAYDYQQRRISVFSLDSFFLSHSIHLDPENWNHIDGLTHSFPTHFFVKDNDTLLMKFTQISQPGQFDEQTYNRYFLSNNKGEVVSDLIHKQRGVEYLISNWGGAMNLLRSPFTRSSLLAVSDKGHIFSAWSEEFLIKVYDPGGRYLRAFYYPYVQSTLYLQDILDLHDGQPSLQQSYRNVTLPETWPALNQMLLDDENRLWVSTITDSEEYYTWWVLDEYGKLLARFDWPGKRLDRDIGRLDLTTVKNGHLYIPETNKKTGLEEIVRYRIEMD